MIDKPVSQQSEAVDPRVAPVLVGVVYGAAVVAAWGFISLIDNLEMMTRADAGPLLGPAMAAAATVSTIAWLVGAWRRRGARSLVASLGAGASAWLLLLATAGIGYSITRGEASWLLLMPASYALSPFAIAPAVLAVLCVGGASVVWRRSALAKPFDRSRRED